MKKISFTSDQDKFTLVLYGFLFLCDSNKVSCRDCEARVKKALESLKQVEEAVVSHESGTAVVKLTKDVSDAVLKKTVEKEGYKVIEK